MKETWWKEAVVYQIYPRSFKDSNGDGIGDIPGIISKLDYLKNLGVDVIWICPMYKSPNIDNGYDVEDYYDIQEEFGTLEDLENLISEAHKRKLKVVMDLIINHTSDKHKWFGQAILSKENYYHDFYIWKDGEEGVLPNNWESHFSGPAWEYVPHLKQYYLHIFSKHQPDLNWKNPKVREEIKKMITFWLDKGIDGFRLDVINFLSKVNGYPSVENVEGLVRGHQYYMNGPEIHDYLKELSSEIFEKYDILTVGETPNVTPEMAKLYVGCDRKELNMLFQFEHMNVDSGIKNKWELKSWEFVEFKRIMSKWQTELNNIGWNSLYLSNHDQPRPLGRFVTNMQYRTEGAKMLGTMIQTMQGTPYIYQGEEIGMTNVKFDSIDDYRDIQTLNLYEDMTNKGLSHDEIMKKIYTKGRDNARTPFQWNDSKNAGFSENEPWLKVNPNYLQINAENQIEDKSSILAYYKELIKLRKKYKVLIYGDFVDYLKEDEALYIYTRNYLDETALVILNFSDRTKEIPQIFNLREYSLLLCNYDSNTVSGESLRPYEGRIYYMKGEKRCEEN